MLWKFFFNKFSLFYHLSIQFGLIFEAVVLENMNFYFHKIVKKKDSQTIYLPMCFYWLNSLLSLGRNIAGQFLTLNLSGNCCHLLNLHSGICCECSFKFWYRLLFFILSPSSQNTMVIFCNFIEVTMHYMELLGLMQSVFLWMSLGLKKALCWTVYQRFYSLMDYANNKL
jgi:hypothetical protein